MELGSEPRGLTPEPVILISLMSEAADRKE